MKTLLSYSTLNALINSPHTWVCKQMQLDTFSTHYLEEGKKAHQIISASVSGKTPHHLLSTLPLFPIVEEVEFDPRTKIFFDIDDNYSVIGYVDGLSQDKDELLEIKSGKVWSALDFHKLMQWRIYALGLPTIKKAWLVNTPRDHYLWTRDNIRVFNTEVTDKHKTEARDFINKGIYIIENIKDAVAKEMEMKKEKGLEGKRSRLCFYVNCPYCE